MLIFAGTTWAATINTDDVSQTDIMTSYQTIIADATNCQGCHATELNAADSKKVYKKSALLLNEDAGLATPLVQNSVAKDFWVSKAIKLWIDAGQMTTDSASVDNKASFDVNGLTSNVVADCIVFDSSLATIDTDTTKVVSVNTESKLDVTALASFADGTGEPPEDIAACIVISDFLVLDDGKDDIATRNKL
jgi:hypothetical protein